MARRVPALVLASFVVTATFAAIVVGAVARQDRNALTVPTVEEGAHVFRGPADARASEWRTDAYLIGVRATEGKPLGADADPPFLYDTSADPTPGDGRALVWTYTYASPSRAERAFHVSMGGDGSLVYARELAAPWSGCCFEMGMRHEGHLVDRPVAYAPPKVAFTIDAYEALRAVADREEFLTFPDDHPVHMTFLELRSAGEASVWEVGHRTASFYHVVAVVDANTGAVQHVARWPQLQPRTPGPDGPDPDPEPPCCEMTFEDFRGKAEGRLTNSRGWFEYHFPVYSRAHAERLVVDASAADVLPGAAIRLLLRDAAGREVVNLPLEDKVTLELREFGASGDWTVAIVNHQLLLTEVPVTIAVALDYADRPLPSPTSLTYTGLTWSYGEVWLPLYFDDAGVASALTLTWSDTLVQDFELVVIDDHGNEVQAARARSIGEGGELAISIDDPGCCHSAIIRTGTWLQPSMSPGIPYTLTVDLVPFVQEAWAQPYHPGHHGH